MNPHRIFTIENFRNIGIDSPQELLIDADLNKVGGLVVVIGENNVGKSNLLDALKIASNEKLTADDRPSFFNCDDKCPKISLEYKDIEIATQDKDDIQNFEGKTFALCFTQGSLNKSLENTDEESYRQSVQAEFDKELSNSSLFALWDKDEQGTRDEIRLILKESQKVYLCSCKKGKRLECFGVLIKKDFENVKNNDRAIELKCKIHIDLDKKSTQEGNADELKEYLKNRNGQSENVDRKTFRLNIKLDEENKVSISNTFEKTKIINEYNIKQRFIYILTELDKGKSKIYESKYKESLEKIKKWFSDKSLNFNNLEVFKKYYQDLEEIYKHIKHNYYGYKVLHIEFKNFEEIAYTESYIDVIKEQFGFPAQPTIHFCELKYLKNSDLSTTLENIDKSPFFTALFHSLPDVDLQNLKSAYEKAKNSNTSDYYRKAGEEINKSIQKYIDKRFNEFFTIMILRFMSLISIVRNIKFLLGLIKMGKP